MSIPEGTVLARAKREGWTRQIESSKALAKREDGPFGVTPVEAVAMSMQEGNATSNASRVCQSGLSITLKQCTAPKSSTPSIKSKSSTKLRAARLDVNDNPYRGFTLNVLNINSLQIEQERTETLQDRARLNHRRKRSVQSFAITRRNHLSPMRGMTAIAARSGSIS